MDEWILRELDFKDQGDWKDLKNIDKKVLELIWQYQQDIKG